MTAAPPPQFAAVWLCAGPGHERHCLDRFYLGPGATLGPAAPRDPSAVFAGYCAALARNCPGAEARLVWSAEAPPPHTCGPAPAD